jgi:hypothetical protein
MKNLQDASERICELKGNLVALDVLTTALIQALPPDARSRLAQRFEAGTEAARTFLLHAPISEHTLAAFEHDIRRALKFVGAAAHAKAG